VIESTSKLGPVILQVRLGVLGSVILFGAASAMGAPQGPKRKLFERPRPQQGQLPGAVLIPAASEGWQPCQKSAASLAAETDQHISIQKNAICFVHVAYAGDGRGTSDDEIIIAGPNKFRLQYPYMTLIKAKGSQPQPILVKRMLLCNANRVAVWEGGKGVISNSAVSKYPFNSHGSALQWATDFPFAMFYALRPGIKPFSALVSAAQAASGDLSVRVEEKKFFYQGTGYHQYRLSVIKKNGGSVPVPKIQITIDALRLLPVTVLTTGQLPGRPPVQVTWRANWGTFKPGKMKESYFAVPSNTKTISK